MSEEQPVENVGEGDIDAIESNYKPPPEKTIEEMIAADQEDESLRKYKEALLGEAQVGKVVIGKYLQLKENTEHRRISMK